jgi:hypothetical protein
MPPKKQATKHPALMSPGALPAVKDELRASLPGWNELKAHHKQWFLVYPFLGNQKQASLYIGKSENWSYLERLKNPHYKKALKAFQSESWGVVNIMRLYGQETAGKALTVLANIMDDEDTTKSLRVDIAKYFIKNFGIGKDETQVNQFNQQNNTFPTTVSEPIPFKGSRIAYPIEELEEPPDVIEVEAVAMQEEGD